jgi:diadenosine tetraphosphate (Ap4A) HIT family hydrolase
MVILQIVKQTSSNDNSNKYLNNHTLSTTIIHLHVHIVPGFYAAPIIIYSQINTHSHNLRR